MSEVLDTAVHPQTWPKILDAHGKIGQSLPASTRQALMSLGEAYAVEPRLMFHFIYVVENYDSAALSTAHFQKRDPFDHPRVVDSFLSACVTAGFLRLNDDGTMQITEMGNDLRRQRWQILNAALAEMELLPEVELAQLNSLLARVVAETAVFAAKSSAWAFQTRQQHGLKPPIAPLAPLAQFIEWRMDLGAFRDDAHLATWRKQYDTSPHDWEVMARIWQDQAKTPAGVSDDLARRGFSKLETAVSLDKLINLGWLTQEHDAYRMTEEGNWVRQTAEQQTNNIFYGPWSTLTPSELKAVQQLLKTVSSKIN